MLLEKLGLSPIVVPADPGTDPEALEATQPKEDPIAYVQRVALIKRDQGLASLKKMLGEDVGAAEDLLIAADTTVALDGRILGKPENATHARQMLWSLSGKTHQVHTAVSIIRLDERQRESIVVSSEVTFAPLSEEWISYYIDTQEPLDKAGAYGIQGLAEAVIPKISGSFSGIVGLPLYETRQLLDAFDFR